MSTKLLKEIDSSNEMEQLFIVFTYANLGGIIEDALLIEKNMKTEEIPLYKVVSILLKRKIKLTLGDVPTKLRRDILYMFIENATITDSEISAYGARCLSKWKMDYTHPVFAEAVDLIIQLHNKGESINGLLEIRGNYMVIELK